MSGRKRWVLSLLPLAGGWLLFRWAGSRSTFDAVLALVASVGGAAIALSAFSRTARIVVAVAAGALLFLDVRSLHQDLRGEHRDEGEDPLRELGGARVEDAWILERSGSRLESTLRVRAMGPSPKSWVDDPSLVAEVWENGRPRSREAPARTRPWTFAVWADARGGADVFAKVRDAIASRRPAFSVGVGDLVGMARRYQFDVLREQMAGTSSPAFFVPGNHDVDPFGTLRPYARVFGPPRWSFVEDGVLFVGLDSSRGRLTDDDAKWLEAQEHRAVKDAPLVLFSHYPLFPPTGRPDKALPQDDEATKRVQALAQRRKALVFCGSYHAFDRMDVGGATQIVTGGAGSKLEGPGGHHFAVVTVGANGLSVEKVDVASKSSPIEARLLVLRDEAAWVSRAMTLRFARVWLLLALAIGGVLAAVGGGSSRMKAAAAALSELGAPYPYQREPGSHA